MKITVIVTTYNRPDALSYVLSALSTQGDLNFNVIVADDGSSSETEQTVKKIQSTSPYDLHHVWQADQGFRAAQIRNQAVLAATGDYLIFIDGDSVPLKNFIARHRRLAERGWFVAGSRVLLSAAFTTEVLSKQLILQNFGLKQWLKLWVNKKINRWISTLSLPLGVLRKVRPTKWQTVKTCNLAVWRQDLLSINGFDEAYTGWGYEDSDLVIRLLRRGIKYKSGYFATPVFHLWHSENDRSQEQSNLQRLNKLRKSNAIMATKGLYKYGN